MVVATDQNLLPGRSVLVVKKAIGTATNIDSNVTVSARTALFKKTCPVLTLKRISKTPPLSAVRRRRYVSGIDMARATTMDTRNKANGGLTIEKGRFIKLLIIQSFITFIIKARDC
jgi:hypothetical protein